MPTTADIFHSGTGADAKCDVLGLYAGQVLEKRSPWRLSIISDFFWAVVNTVTFLYVHLSSPEATVGADSYLRALASKRIDGQIR